MRVVASRKATSLRVKLAVTPLRVDETCSIGRDSEARYRIVIVDPLSAPARVEATKARVLIFELAIHASENDMHYSWA